MREMKDSGINYIGLIPQTWKTTTTKRLFRVESGATPATDKPENFDGQITWITPADYKTNDVYVSTGRRNLSEEGLSSCSAVLVPAGSIIFSKRAPIGSVAIASKELCTNQGCLSCVPQNEVSSEFFYYCMSVLTEQYQLLGTGTTFKEISLSSFANFALPFPSFLEQSRIAAYLDRRCAAIDALIANQQQQIDKLKQYKQAVITEAVTRGLDPNVRMKDSGVEWIGEVPEHWRIIRGKWLFHETNERSKTGEEELLSVSHITGITPRSQKNVNMFMAESLVDYKICHVNDIASNTMWMWQGAIGVSKHHGVISPSYNTYRQTNNDYDSRYLDYMLRIEPIIHEYISRSSGIVASRLRLYPDDFFEIMFFVPPQNEQQQIVAYLDTQCAQIDALIALKQQKADKLAQYKKSLIYEVVTGKREV